MHCVPFSSGVSEARPGARSITPNYADCGARRRDALPRPNCQAAEWPNGQITALGGTQKSAKAKKTAGSTLYPKILVCTVVCSMS
jgi:hypothetical protein